MRILQFFKHYIFSILIFGIIYYLSTANPSTFSAVPKIEGLDKVVHVLMYLAFAFFLFFEVPQKKSYARYFFTIFFPIFYGGGMELVQKYFFPLRSAEWGDFFADAIGVLLGYLLAKRLFKIERIRKIIQFWA